MGLAELFAKTAWRFLPEDWRIRLSAKIAFAQKIAETRVPRNEVLVYPVREDRSHANFEKAFAPEFELADVRRQPHPSYSLITTCYNEKTSVELWLDSVAAQTVLPTQVVICDGGSTDGTPEIIEEWFVRRAIEVGADATFDLQVVRETNCNIAEGRNVAVAHAQYPIILASDLGCRLDPHWAEYMLIPFMHRADTEVVAGWYRATYPTSFGRAVGRYLIPRLADVDPHTVLPSARSLAFQKEVWLRVGGFPSYLTFAGEDTLFDFFLKQHCSRWAFVPAAIVEWIFPRSISSIAQTIFGYARGDGEAATLFWNDYLALLKRVAALACETLFFLIALFVWSITGGIVSGLLSLVFLGFVAKRIYSVLAPYRPFAEEHGGNWLHLLAAAFVVVCQTAGFIVGASNSRVVEERRLELERKMRDEAERAASTG